MKWTDFVPHFVSTPWNQWKSKMEQALVYFKPAYLSQNHQWFSPVVAIVALIMTIVLIGVALTSFMSLFISLLVLYFIITKIFGIELAAPDVFRV